ncbi:unnamed protein product [Candida verbasci]|uniref:Uncharacterized protein n=1 Tax=Candida verbasci TaxID=1227364 RepID=A0A9W4XJC0_9ASCO|nr:unnamed protein product [Candida verbasci]
MEHIQFDSSEKFQCDNALIYSIKPSINSESGKSDIDFGTKLWKGSIRLIEQEEINNDHNEDHKKLESRRYLISPYTKLRLKLELYNDDNLWGETWYNPIDLNKRDLNLNNANISIQKLKPISKDKEETIAKIDDGLYKIIAQLPDTGYQPIIDGENNTSNADQIALCLKITNSKQNSKFEKALESYNKKYKEEQHSYYYNQLIYIVNQLNFNLDETLKDNEEDEFGDFVSN